ncbi:MAG: RraA family protein [Oscillospiraceae bacterium]|nr:RraA family protein [Oscillospiraceae bacterium]
MLSLEQMEELRAFDVPTVWNALEGFKLRPNTVGFTGPGLFLRTPDKKPMIGYAVTAKISGLTPPTDEQKDMLFAYFEDIYNMNVPAVAVMQDIDARPIGSFWGEVQATTCKALGAAGTLTHGGVRDLNEVGALGFSFFSTDIMVARAESHLIERGGTVHICGMEVAPGDLVFADTHGAITIPAEAAPTLAAACRRVADAELFVLEPCRKAIESGVKPTPAELRKWRGEMAKHK